MRFPAVTSALPIPFRIELTKRETADESSSLSRILTVVAGSRPLISKPISFFWSRCARLNISIRRRSGLVCVGYWRSSCGTSIVGGIMRYSLYFQGAEHHCSARNVSLAHGFYLRRRGGGYPIDSMMLVISCQAYRDNGISFLPISTLYPAGTRNIASTRARMVEIV